MAVKKHDSQARQGIEALREQEPCGPQQFAGILDTKMGEGPGHVPASGGGTQIDGLGEKELQEARALEKKYAAARRAAIAGGHTTLYE